MKQLISVIAAITLIGILLSCMTAGANATSVPKAPFYVHYPVTSYLSGMPKTIKAQFDYDRDFIDIVPDYPDKENYPSFDGVGFTFPLAGTEYGSLYDVSYTVDDTVITYTYTLKSGCTFDDYLDALDAINAANGAAPVSREAGALHRFPIFDIAMRIDRPVYYAKIIDHKVLEVITADGRELHENGTQNGDVVTWYAEHYLPDPDAADDLPGSEPVYKYKDKLLRQYNISEDALIGYEEFYEHTDKSGAVDWALVRTFTKHASSSPGWTHPAYYEFGNRVMDIEDRYEPFAFGVGIYSAEHDCFFDVYAPELYELNDLERVWTQIGAGRLIGDLDGDDRLTINDATLIQRCQAKMTDYPDNDQNIPTDYVTSPFIPYYSDFDQDGERSILDATAIQRYLAHMPYRSASWTPFPHADQPTPPQPDPTEPEPTEPSPAPTEPNPSAPSSDILNAPQITRIEAAEDKGVIVTWTPVEGAALYRVFAKPRFGDGNDRWTAIADTSATVYHDTKTYTGNEAYYTVCCLRQGGTEPASDYDRVGTLFKLQSSPPLSTHHVNMDSISFETRGDMVIYRRTKENGPWSKIGEARGRKSTFYDHDVVPDTAYYYTARYISEDGIFLSNLGTNTGYYVDYKVSQCEPEFEFVMYSGDNLVLVQPKDDNKFGIKHFALDVKENGEYLGTYYITDEPCYLNGEFFEEGRGFVFELVGTDDEGNEITRSRQHGFAVKMLAAPSNLTVEAIGDRQYRLSWVGDLTQGGYEVTVYVGESEIPQVDSGYISDTAYVVDLSGYPEDTDDLTCFVWAADEDEICYSLPIVLTFHENESP